MKKAFNYRHVLCWLVLLGSVLCSVFLFPQSLTRLLESFRDFGLSVAYWFVVIFEIPSEIAPTVAQLSSVPYRLPFHLPSTWDGVEVYLASYWNTFASIDTFRGYLLSSAESMVTFAKFMPFVVLIIFAVLGLINNSVDTPNNDYNKDSKALEAYKKVARHVFLPVKRWILSVATFVKAHKVYPILFLVVWAFNFNLFAVVVSFLAYYFYFSVSFDFAGIVRQLYKLVLDLSGMVDFVPGVVWLCFAVVVLAILRRKRGYLRLKHMERMNRGFINARPIVTMCCGSMGKAKTTVITDMALSTQVEFRDRALDILRGCDNKFPYFPWINLEQALKTAIQHHEIYTLATVRQYVRIKHQRWEKHQDNSRIFGYDYQHYGLEYYDNLAVCNVWEAIETYAQAYFIYIFQSALLIANYSIRVDDMVRDQGNFPLWDTDFFKRDGRMTPAVSRNSHVIDYDALRLGKKMVENNMASNYFEFGVVVLTEIGKERGNNLELREVKKVTEDVNQKNDLFNSWLKMVRHSATVDHYPFVRVLVDEQRPESWGADARDLCDIVFIKERGEKRLAMPFFALAEIVHGTVGKWFTGFYTRYRFNRGDNTLFMYLLKSLVSTLERHYSKTYNLFGYQIATVALEDGTMDGESKLGKYFLCSKKIYSNRFSTDAFSDVFEKRALKSPVGLGDVPAYRCRKAQVDEMASENSYFFEKLLQLMHDKE